MYIVQELVYNIDIDQVIEIFEHLKSYNSQIKL